ncbi:MAG TPA: 2-oxo-4-hydroxy-4-carboxy-5-ureidoimidazoline decarboxylase [Thermoanaerobaculia bacterium]|nr:2-oxo-4-hydroxy-4-carboxy-5-ureidoimidazoline decarboxylase [Thermoanaerobaculia bacterium]
MTTQDRLARWNAGSREAFVAALGHLFEHSPWVAEAAFEGRPFRDPEHLHAQLCAAMRGAGHARQRALILAHPDLAGRLGRAAALTAESAREQASAGLDEMAQDEAAELARLNRTYRERFGFPFILCARLNHRDAILAALRVRLESSPEQEHETALAEIEKIAWLRLQDLLKG